jgi:4-hydroxyphenylpyruvate dioxygenase-like putative hemolysin
LVDVVKPLIVYQAISELINPVAALIGRLGYAEIAERKKANVELWMQCWARIGAITNAHDLKVRGGFCRRHLSQTQTELELFFAKGT